MLQSRLESPQELFFFFLLVRVYVYFSPYTHIERERERQINEEKRERTKNKERSVNILHMVSKMGPRLWLSKLATWAVKSSDLGS